MVQIKDIARRCKVSPATVSKALNDRPDISEATKKRVREVADEMGYFSNSLARALKTGKTNNLGVLFVDEQNKGLSHEFFSTILESIKANAEKNGYDITFISANKNMTFLQRCRHRGFDGVIIANIDYTDKQVKELVDSDIPVVTIDYDFGNKVSIMSDNVSGGRALIEYAYEMGHRNFGIIHGELTGVTRKRLEGIYEFLEEKGLDIPKCNIKEAQFHNNAMTYIATQELLRQPDRPTCILFQDDYSYVGGYNAIHDMGLSIPEDISTMGYDGIELSRILSPRLVTYHQDTETIGRIAVEKILEQMENPDLGHEIITVSGYLLSGGSVSKL